MGVPLSSRQASPGYYDNANKNNNSYFQLNNYFVQGPFRYYLIYFVISMN